MGKGRRLAMEGLKKGESCLRLAPGGRSNGPGAATPKMITAPPKVVNPLVGLLSCFLIHLHAPPEPGQQFRFQETPRLSHLPTRYNQGPGPGMERLKEAVRGLGAPTIYR